MQTGELCLYPERDKGLTLVNVSYTDLQQIYRMSWQVPALVKVAPRMGWMKSFSKLSCFTFDHGLHCTERNLLETLQGKRPTRSLNRNENNRDKSQTAVSVVECFAAFGTTFFAAFFAALFAMFFLCAFRHVFRLARACKLVCQGISIHVTTKCLCP